MPCFSYSFLKSFKLHFEDIGASPSTLGLLAAASAPYVFLMYASDFLFTEKLVKWMNLFFKVDFEVE